MTDARSQPAWNTTPKILSIPRRPRKTCYICGWWQIDRRLTTIGWCARHANISHVDGGPCEDFTLSPFTKGGP